MASGNFDIGLGRCAEFYYRVKNGDPSTSRFGILLLKVAQADGTLEQHETVAAVTGANTEANFTNYARKTIAAASMAAMPSPDHTNHVWDFFLPNQTWLNAGATTDNALVKAILYYMANSGSADSTFIPCKHYDFVFTTVKPAVSLVFNDGGAWREQPA